jgi:hypothetical protein
MGLHVTEQYTEWFTRNERNGIARMKARFWKLKGLKRVTDKGSCPLRLGKKDAKLILLRCPQRKKFGEQNLQLQSGLT